MSAPAATLGPLAAAVLEALREGAATIAEVSAATGHSVQGVEMELRELRREGAVVSYFGPAGILMWRAVK